LPEFVNFDTIGRGRGLRPVERVPLIIVTSDAPGAGKTGVAAAIGRHYAYLGRPVRLARIAGETPGEGAVADAAYFGSLDFAPGSSSLPVTWDAVAGPGDIVAVAETDTLPDPLPDGAHVVYVTRAGSDAKAPDGATAVRSFVPATGPAAEGAHPEIHIPEDRTLAGFGVADIRAALNAQTIVEGDDPGETCDHLVIAPIASDAGQPYFRRFGTQAVVVRFDKTDMHLAAMQADPVCLVLTGGRMPSGYLFDAAGAKGVPVLLSGTDTENTVIALEGIFDRTRFGGERKLGRMAELLEGSGLFESLAL
jgi:hypothetical protein